MNIDDSSSDEEGDVFGRMGHGLFEEDSASAEKRELALDLRKQQLDGRSKWAKFDTKEVDIVLREPLQDKILTLIQDLKTMQATIWPCSVVLARFLEKQGWIVHGKRVIELGSGIGLPGLMAGKIGAQYVAITDREHAVEWIKLQIDSNDFEGVQVEGFGLEWTEPHDHIRPENKYEVILCSDLIYAGDSATTQSLVKTIRAISRDDCVVLSCFEIRGVGDTKDASKTQEKLFHDMLLTNGFAFVKEFSKEMMDQECQDPTIFIKQYARATNT